MRILILTAIPFWHPGTNELIEELRTKGIRVDALDIFHGFFFDENSRIIKLVPLPNFFRRLYIKLFRRRILKKFARQYDVLDLHFVEPYYAKYVLDIPNKLICTLFGSDLFRTNEVQKKMQAPLFEKAEGIVLSKNMLEYFEKSFGSYDEKYLFCQYGSKRLDMMENVRDKDDSLIRIIVGYNNKREQQHIAVLNTLKNLSENWKNRIEVVLPMTYGDDVANQAEVETAVSNMGFRYKLYKSRLSDSEIVELWQSANIMLNMQTTDALASSIKEAIAAGNLLIVGDWLPYGIYSDLGIYFKTVNFANLESILIESLVNLDSELIQCSMNRNKVVEFASWTSLINDWIANYKRLCFGSR